MEIELKIIIYNVLARYREVEGKHCYDETPKTDLQEAMQRLEKAMHFHSPSLKDDKQLPCQEDIVDMPVIKRIKYKICKVTPLAP